MVLFLVIELEVTAKHYTKTKKARTGRNIFLNHLNQNHIFIAIERL